MCHQGGHGGPKGAGPKGAGQQGAGQQGAGQQGAGQQGAGQQGAGPQQPALVRARARSRAQARIRRDMVSSLPPMFRWASADEPGLLPSWGKLAAGINDFPPARREAAPPPGDL